MSFAFWPVAADAVSDTQTWITVALAALNTVQTIALAYLAAERFKRNHRP